MKFYFPQRQGWARALRIRRGFLLLLSSRSHPSFHWNLQNSNCYHLTFRLHPANAKTVEWDWKLLAYVMEEEVTTVCMSLLLRSLMINAPTWTQLDSHAPKTGSRQSSPKYRHALFKSWNKYKLSSLNHWGKRTCIVWAPTGFKPYASCLQ